MTSKNKIGRPKLSDAQKEATRTLLLNCAKEAFLKDGFQSVSIRKIAKAADCHPMSVYSYFESKQALLRELWRGFFDELFLQCNAAADKHDSPLIGAIAFLKAYSNYWLAHKERFRLVFLVEDRLVGQDDSYYVDSDMIHKKLDPIRKKIAQACDLGEIADNDPELTTQLLLASIMGLLHVTITISEFSWSSFDIMLNQILMKILEPVNDVDISSI